MKSASAPKTNTPGRRSLWFLKGLSILVALVFAAGLFYFLVYPLVPDFNNLRTILRQHSPYNLGYQTTVQLFVKIAPPTEYVTKESGIDDDSSIEVVKQGVLTAELEKLKTRLVIPSIAVNGAVVDGTSQNTMFKGFWHYPSSSVPGRRGNTVIIGHRFDKLPPDPRTFFNLDKVKVGDKIRLTQIDRIYEYTVVSTRVVSKTDRSVLADTGDYRLTLITCTPLWTADKRLVVVAVQDRVGSAI